jgi:hypothetical protein
MTSSFFMEVESGAVPCQTDSSDSCGQIHQSDSITANRVGNGMQHQHRSLKTQQLMDLLVLNSAGLLEVESGAFPTSSARNSSKTNRGY